MRLRISAANLTVGGALGVAASFVDELPRLSDEGELRAFSSIDLYVSEQVARALTQKSRICSVPNLTMFTATIGPWRSLGRRSKLLYDVNYTVFGPAFMGRLALLEVSGFADGTLLFPASQWMRSSRRAAVSLRDSYKRHRLGQYDALILETDLMRDWVSQRYSGIRTAVVSNTVPRIFQSPEMWTKVKLPKRQSGDIRLFYPARGYPHKNHAMLRRLISHFESAYKLRLTIIVTLSDLEMDATGLRECPGIVNVGVQPLSSVPYLYTESDGVIFPSLLETSSATPLEARFMGKPLFCSNAPSVRDVVGDGPFYFDPLRAEDAAKAIYYGLVAPSRSAQQRLRQWRSDPRGSEIPTSLTRARQIIRLLSGEQVFAVASK